MKLWKGKYIPGVLETLPGLHWLQLIHTLSSVGLHPLAVEASVQNLEGCSSVWSQPRFDSVASFELGMIELMFSKEFLYLLKETFIKMFNLFQNSKGGWILFADVQLYLTNRPYLLYIGLSSTSPFRNCVFPTGCTWNKQR